MNTVIEKVRPPRTGGNRGTAAAGRLPRPQEGPTLAGMTMPHASERIAAWRDARDGAGAMLLALDFDGTLAPIVPRPGDAIIYPRARAALQRIARDARTRVAIVSGRGLDDARRRVDVAGLFFAGNHGLEIEGPGVHRHHEEALAVRPALQACADRLRAELGRVDGVIVEDKGLTLSVHFRLVTNESAQADIVRRVRATCGASAALRTTEGKKVVEVRPAVDWDKGRATAFLLDALLGDVPDAPAIFIGDDRTDEDAFRALDGRGEGVIVGDPPPPRTLARSYVRSPAEVADLLEALADE
jgi:trehalose 6-phosphate phosphatase